MEMTLPGKSPYIETEEQSLLIVTGSPASISRAGYIKLDGKYCFLHNQPPTGELYRKFRKTAWIRECLLGMDVLKYHSLLLDYGKKQVFFDPRRPGKPSFTAKIDMEARVPRIAGTINGKKHMFILDTGSELSFLLFELTKGLDRCGWSEQSHPVYGGFGTPCYLLDTAISRKTFKLRFGPLPKFAEQTLVEAGASGVLGHEFLSRHRVLLDFKHGKLAFFGGDGEDGE